jgi:hypothetical protein
MNKRGGALIDDALIVRLIRLTLFGHGKLHVTRAKKESSVQSQMQSTVMSDTVDLLIMHTIIMYNSRNVWDMVGNHIGVQGPVYNV